MAFRSVSWALPLALSLGLLGPPAASAAPITWIAGEMPPFAWSNASGAQGFAYELAAQMAFKLGRPHEFAFYPWARSVRMAEEGDQYGIFPLARTADREAHFNWLIPLLHVRYTFYGKAGGKLNVFSLAQLRTARIGVLRGSPLIRTLQTQEFTQIVEHKDYRDLLRALAEGMVDAVYAGTPMMAVAIEEYGHGPQDFSPGLGLGDATLYMATGLKADAQECARWLSAYKELQQEGVVARLRKKYIHER